LINGRGAELVESALADGDAVVALMVEELAASAASLIHGGPSWKRLEISG
jgi:hypothetical protein